MSFDLAIWRQTTMIDPDQAFHIYDQLTDGIAGVVEASLDVSNFYDAVMEAYPDADDETDDDDSPWASEVYRTEECVLLAISWSRKGELKDFVLRTAGEKGLAVYDPQSRAIYLPSA
ncbi:hypothetical protein [Actinoplanes sp. L3-i22]|uniref:hypothetical protein n=1 Tax=Actinoplanes sp. L3-i22 TaxID=2836373 RepID=UPI001C8440DC|nr:hypothetical protein [Actinoplanes sp. L3-i22]